MPTPIRLLAPFVLGLLPACVADARAEEDVEPEDRPTDDSGGSDVTDVGVEALTRFAATPEYTAQKAWAAARGVRVEPGVTSVLVKRRFVERRATAYEDLFVVFQRSGGLRTFVGNAKPAQMPRPTGTTPDVDGNGTRDLGVARAGTYRAVGGWTFGLPGHARPAFRILQNGKDALPGWRDTDGDGAFSAAERAASERRGDRITLVRIHYGFDPGGNTFGGAIHAGPWSTGCLNIPWSQLDAFVAAVGGAKASFDVAIVDER